MGEPRYDELHRHFAAACELRGEARAAYLRSACGDDESLRRELERVDELLELCLKRHVGTEEEATVRNAVQRIRERVVQRR